MKKYTLLLAFLVLLNVSSHAWNKRGHMLAASIAYDQMSDTRTAMFTELLKQHLYFDEWMEEYKNESGIELGRYLFMRAAAWADDIKSRSDDFPFVNESWHYSNFRVDYNGGHDTRRISPQADILYAMSWGKRLMTEKWNRESGKSGFRYNDGYKALAFSWLLHLIGDIHQPLHCATLFNEIYPDGDDGGNKVCIRKDQKAKTDYSLHSFWDQLPGSNDVSMKTIVKQGKDIEEKFSQVEHEKLTEVSPYEWAYESHRLAILNVYQNGIIGKDQAYKAKDLCPVIPENYEENAEQLAEKRLYFAGKRMAAFLIKLQWVE